MSSISASFRAVTSLVSTSSQFSIRETDPETDERVAAACLDMLTAALSDDELDAMAAAVARAQASRVG
jgi:hypothetical protein